MSESTVSITLNQKQDYCFTVDFGANVPPLLTDEPAPLGAGAGPSPVQLLAAAVGNCLADSLLFALRKFKQAPEPLRCEVTAETGRNAENRLRVQKITAQLHLGVEAATLNNLARVLGSFEAYCTVTQSVGQGIAIETQVYDSKGVRLK